MRKTYCLIWLWAIPYCYLACLQWCIPSKWIFTISSKCVCIYQFYFQVFFFLKKSAQILLCCVSWNQVWCHPHSSCCSWVICCPLQGQIFDIRWFIAAAAANFRFFLDYSNFLTFECGFECHQYTPWYHSILKSQKNKELHGHKQGCWAWQNAETWISAAVLMLVWIKLCLVSKEE